MAGNPHQFFANTAVAAIHDGNKVYALSTLQNLDASIAWEITPLYGIGSIKQKNRAKHTQKVTGTVDYAEFDPTIADDFYESICNVDGSAEPGAVQDTPKVKTLTIYANVKSFDDTPVDYTVMLVDAYFPEVSLLNLQMNEWVKRNLKFEAVDVKRLNSSIPESTSGA